MAEATGLVIGAVSLAGLFSTCVECMEYVSLGRNHGQDFEVSMAKMILLKARLNAWGESLHVSESGHELAVLRDRWIQEQEIVGKALVGIKDIFQDSHTLEKKYGLHKVIYHDSQPVSTSHAQTSPSLQDIERAFRVSTNRRQQETSLWKKTVWAVCDKKRFDILIGNLAFYIDNLERLSDRLVVLGFQQQLLQARVQDITSIPGITLLEKAVVRSDIPPDPSESERPQGEAGHRTDGHRYIGTIILDRARVINGDIGDSDFQSQRHVYENTRASGGAKVVQGNTSADFAKEFFH